MRPPVVDMSLKAACNAGPRALWVSVLWLNMAGREVSRSFTSCREGQVQQKYKSDHQSQQEQMKGRRNEGSTSLLSFKLTIRLS